MAYPEFDKRERFGPSIEGAVPSGRIARTRKAVSQRVTRCVCYKNRQLFVIVINVVTPQERYEGRVQGFVDRPPTFEINGLKAGCIVGSATTIFGALNEGGFSPVASLALACAPTLGIRPRSTPAFRRRLRSDLLARWPLFSASTLGSGSLSQYHCSGMYVLPNGPRPVT
jgi:hypothetical protein